MNKLCRDKLLEISKLEDVVLIKKALKGYLDEVYPGQPFDLKELLLPSLKGLSLEEMRKHSKEIDEHISAVFEKYQDKSIKDQLIEAFNVCPELKEKLNLK